VKTAASADNVTVIARSGIGVAVRKGAPCRISRPEAFAYVAHCKVNRLLKSGWRWRERRHFAYVRWIAWELPRDEIETVF
jgi:hypothetical protein